MPVYEKALRIIATAVVLIAIIFISLRILVSLLVSIMA